MRIHPSQTANRRRRQAGVSLLEAIVSMGIFGVSFFSLYAGMSMGFSIIGNARENLRATQVMVEKMETIRLYSWDQINTPGFIPTSFSESYAPEGGGGTEVATEGGEVASQVTRSTPGIVYSGTVTVGNGPTGHSYSADLRRVVITLSWTSGNRTHNRSMTTYVSRNGLQNYIY